MLDSSLPSMMGTTKQDEDDNVDQMMMMMMAILTTLKLAMLMIYQFSYMFPGNLYFSGCQALLLTTGNINFLFCKACFLFAKLFSS